MSDYENVQIMEDQDTEMIDASAETKTEPGLYKNDQNYWIFYHICKL